MVPMQCVCIDHDLTFFKCSVYIYKSGIGALGWTYLTRHRDTVIIPDICAVYKPSQLTPSHIQ